MFLRKKYSFITNKNVNLGGIVLEEEMVKNKKEERIPPFCPKSYHELNLLMFR